MKKSKLCVLSLALVTLVTVGAKSQAECFKPNFIFKCIPNFSFLCEYFPQLPCIPQKPSVPQQPDVQPDAPQEPDVQPDVQPDTPQEPDVQPDVPQQPDIQPDVPQEPDVPEIDNSAHAYEKQVLDLVNVEREKHGLTKLSWSDELADVARAHSKDMLNRGFFSHTNPDGKSPFDRIRAAGISYRSAGENIAAGQKTPQEVVDAWMNSEGHRANILNASFTKLGVGYVSGNGAYSTYWTQNFAG